MPWLCHVIWQTIPPAFSVAIIVCISVWYLYGWDFSRYRWISGFRCLSEGNKNGFDFEMHFECEVSTFRNFNLVPPCICFVRLLVFKLVIHALVVNSEVLSLSVYLQCFCFYI